MHIANDLSAKVFSVSYDFIENEPSAVGHHGRSREKCGGDHFCLGSPSNCLIRQAKAWNDDFDRGKSEQLKTKRIGRSRNITSLSRCTGNRLHTTLSGRDQGWCTKSEHFRISKIPLIVLLEILPWSRRYAWICLGTSPAKLVSFSKCGFYNTFLVVPSSDGGINNVVFCS